MTPLPLDNILAAAIQAGLIALAGAPLPRLFDVWSPRARLLYWRGLMIACVLVPLLAPRAVVSPPPATVPVAAPGDAVSITAAEPPAAGQNPGPPAAWTSRLPALSLPRILAAGIALRALWLVLGLVTLSRLRRKSRRLWPRPAALDDAVAAAGTDAEFLVSDRALRPMTFGFLRPVVLVPADFTDFTPEQQKAIACHELLHVRRLDWLRTAADEVVRTLAWFHPAAWWLTGQLHLSREQLVDEEVVRHMGSRRPYLDALLHLASSERRGALLPASLFLGRAHLAQRVALLVKEVHMSRPRLVLSFVAMAAVLALCGQAAVAAFPLTVPAEARAGAAGQQAARPGISLASSEPFTFRGENAPVRDVLNFIGKFAGVTVLYDPSVGNPAPVTMDLDRVTVQAALNTVMQASGLAYQVQDPKTIVVFRGVSPTPGQAKPSPSTPIMSATGAVRKTRDARPAFPPGAPSEPLVLEAVVDVTGHVTEVTTITGSSDLGAIAATALEQWQLSPPPKAPHKMLFGFNPAAGGSDPAGQPPVLVGRNVKAPVKTKDVKPVYPQEARDARVQGVVILEVRIDTDGQVSEARILRSIPMLDRAALEAVLQWKYQPPGLPLQMTVTCNFTLQGRPAQGVAGGISGGVGGGVGGGVAGGVGGGVAGGIGGGTGSGTGSGVGSGIGGGVGGGVAGGVTTGITLDQTWAGGYLRVGGNIKAPTKVKDVKPVYPDAALQANAQGVVIVEARIGPDGLVEDARILRSIPLLDKAALEAVSQWEYTPTLLNGAPIGVVMTVTVNFTLQ
jgi:TonB family protein